MSSRAGAPTGPGLPPRTPHGGLILADPRPHRARVFLGVVGGTSEFVTDTLQRARRWLGGPRMEARGRGAALAGWWSDGASSRVTSSDNLLLDGWTELAPEEVLLRPEALSGAAGDFVCLALDKGGVLFATGRSGGYRPIFLARTLDGVALACTSLWLLVQLLPDEPTLDRQHIACALSNQWGRAGTSTPYTNIVRAPMGQVGVLKSNDILWRWPNAGPAIGAELLDGPALASQLREAVSRSVRRCLKGGVSRPAVRGAGGLDSSLLLGVCTSMARTGEINPPIAIAYDFAAPPWHDDRPHLRSLEGHLGLRAYRVSPGRETPNPRNYLVVDGLPATMPWLCLSEQVGGIARSQGASVLLTGDGGDHLLDGNPRLFAQFVRRGQVARALDGALRTRGVFYHGRLGRLARFIVAPLVEPWFPSRAMSFARRLRRSPPSWWGPALRPAYRHYFEPTQATAAESTDARYARFLRTQPFGPLSIHRHQEEAVGGCLIRWPLLDDEFLRFVARLPPLSLMRGGYLRGLMREAMTDLVPDDLRLRRTKGSLAWLIDEIIKSGGGLEVFADLADVRMLSRLGLVDAPAFRRFFKDFEDPASKDVEYSDLWRVLAWEAFLRQDETRRKANQ